MAKVPEWIDKEIGRLTDELAYIGTGVKFYRAENDGPYVDITSEKLMQANAAINNLTKLKDLYAKL